MRDLRLIFFVFLLAGMLHGQKPSHQIFTQQVNTHLAVNLPFRNHEIGMNLALPKLEELGVRMYRHFTYGDVLWQQVEPENDQWNFVYSDSAIYNPYQIASLATLYSFCTGYDTIGLQVPWRACDGAGCGWHLSDSTDSKDYVMTVVNRYKDVVKYWEISNELDGHQHRPVGLPPKEIPEFLKLNYRWIKSIQPEAKILQPSLSGTYGLPLGSYDWLRIVLINGGYDYFDILGYHDYNSWWTLPAHVDSIKRAFRECGYEPKPMWVTECSISSDPTTNITPRYSSIDGQAADVWRRTAILFAEGVEKFFWHPFWSGAYRPWLEFGLLDSEGKKKKSFYSFQLLISEIDTFLSAEKISYGEVTNDNLSGGDGVWAIKFTFSDGRKKWVLWSPNNLSYTLSLEGYNFAEVIHVVPTYISEDGETASFQRDTVSVTNGELSLHLTEFPVLVKGTNLEAIEKNHPIPEAFKLYENYPNPFGSASSSGTFILYYVPHKSHITIKVYDILGREIKTLVNGIQAKGKHSVLFKPNSLSAGIYFYTLQTDGVTITKKLLITK